MEIDENRVRALIKEILEKVTGKKIDDDFLEVEFVSDYPEVFARCYLESYDDTVEWEKDTTQPWHWEPHGVLKSFDVQVDQYVGLDIVDGVSIFYFAVLNDDGPDSDEFQTAIEKNQETGEFVELDKSKDLIQQLEAISGDPEKIKLFSDAIKRFYGPCAEDVIDEIPAYERYYEASKTTKRPRLRETSDSDLLFIANRIHSAAPDILKFKPIDYINDPFLLEYLIEDYLKSNLSERFDTEKIYSNYDSFKSLLLGLFEEDQETGN